MKAGKFLVALLAVAAQDPAYAAEPPLVFAPTGKWVADFATENCALRRNFASDGKTLLLELNSFTYGDTFQVKIYSPDLSVLRTTPKTRFEPDDMLDRQDTSLGVTFTDGGKGILYRDTVFGNNDLKPYSDEWRVWMASLANDHAGRDRREKEITGLFVANGFSKDIRIQTGSLHGAMEIMRQCLADLAGTEGLDPQKITALTREPQWKDQGRSASRMLQEYPVKMLREGKSAMVDIRLIVDEAGKPVDCKARDNGQDDSFTETTCDNLMQYARFDPALDATGNPVKAYWATTVIFRLQ